MNKIKRIRNYNISVGSLTPGKKNAITDISGVKVGHYTLDRDKIKTGVTAILPHNENLFKKKVVAATHIINGFGKSTGLIQIDELGTIETPIILTNTLNVGIAHQAVVKKMIDQNLDIGNETGTVNPVVCECNDQYLNDIRGLHIKEEHVFKALANADDIFLEGAVGSGTGMSCYGLKGGIGSASRELEFNDKNFHLGILVLSNFGKKEDFRLDGIKAGKIIKDIEEKKGKKTREPEQKGSIIIILATDLPLNSRQLKRVIKRTGVGINRTGAYIENGSGEIVIGFSTANRVDHYEKNGIVNIKRFNENKINKVFKATVETTEEAIYNSLITAKTTKGKKDRVRYSLKEYINEIDEKSNRM
ncbi:MAG: P1 family peptidase [Bacillota bacterium]